jgi:hypothetical protein
LKIAKQAKELEELAEAVMGMPQRVPQMECQVRWVQIVSVELQGQTPLEEVLEEFLEY